MLRRRAQSNRSNCHKPGIVDWTIRRPEYSWVRRRSLFSDRSRPSEIAWLMTGGCGILLLTKLGGYLFDVWTPGAPFFIMALLNVVALVAAIIVILVDQKRPKIQLPDDEEEDDSPLLTDQEV